jgi:isoamylase
MLLGGDELGRTQLGNNNAWCQDNELSWFDWGAADEDLRAFTARLLALRAAEPVFRRTRFLDGGPAASSLPDAWWFRADGRTMAQRDWQSDETRVLGVFLNGDHAEPVADSFIVIVNATLDPVAFRLPPRRFGLEWSLELSTAEPARGGTHRGRSTIEIEGFSLALLRRSRA